MNAQQQSDIKAYVGRRLRTLRESRGVDPEKLAAILSTPMAKYAEYELGRAQIPACTLFDLSCFFDLPVTHFFSEYEYNRESSDGPFPSEPNRSST